MHNYINNEFDRIVEVRSKLEAEVLNSFSVSSSARPATKLIKCEGISSIFDKTLELIRNTLFNSVSDQTRSWLTTSRGLLILDKVHSEEFVSKLAS